MRLSIGTLNYPPSSAPIAPIVAGLAQGLSGLGHDVVVYSGTPGSASNAVGPEIIELSYSGIKRREHPERVLGYLSFGNALSRGLKESGAEVAIMFTPPPLLPLFVKGRMPIIYSIQDLYPEVIRYSTLPLTRALAAGVGPFEAAAQRRATRCVVLGKRIGEIVAQRVSRDRVTVIPNPLVYPENQDPETVVSWRDLFGSSGPVVIYSGNVGRTLDWELVLASASRLAKERVHFAIVGQGTQTGWIDEQIAARDISNAKRFPPWPGRSVRSLLSTAAVGLVPCHSRVALYSYPSKAAIYMSAGLPVVATAERASDLADLLAESSAGSSVEPGDVTGFCDAVLAYVNDSTERAAAGKRGREYVERELGLDLAVGRYAEACAAAVELESN